MLQDYDSSAISQKVVETEHHRSVMLSFDHLKGQLKEDGNQWCAIVGQMPENYIAGFGITPMSAIYDWWNEMHKQKK